MLFRSCNTKFSTGLCNGYNCQSCGRWLCVKCAVIEESQVVKTNGDYREVVIKSCKFCNGFGGVKYDGGRRNIEKVYPSKSPRDSPEPPSPFFSGELIQSDRLAHYFKSRDCRYPPLVVSRRAVTSFSAHPSLVFVRRSPSRYIF